MNQNSKNPITLARWILRSYLKTALLPIVMIELVFLSIFFSINIVMKNELSTLLSTAYDRQIARMTNLEAQSIDSQLDSIIINTKSFAAQMGKALQIQAELSPMDASRLAYSADGAYYTTADSGGAAVYYSGIIPINEKERNKVAKTLTMQDLMKDIYEAEPLISSIYINTHDSLNVIYPYLNVTEQYAPKIDITTFNFYYEADGSHNPEKTVKWTDVYLDPAGRGWMTSAIAPIYNRDVLEGVVGIDIAVEDVVNQLLKVEIPSEGYGLLVGSDGTVFAMTDKAKEALNMEAPSELDGVIKQNTFLSDRYNLSKIPSMTEITPEIIENSSGTITQKIDTVNSRVSWVTVKETGWKLLVIIPEASVFAAVNQLGFNVQKIGVALMAGMVLFFVVFFRTLMVRSRKMSENLSQPLVALNTMADSIGAGNYIQESLEFGVKELQETSENIADMGRRIGDINSHLLEAQKELKDNEFYLKAVISSIDDAIVELDENGVITNLTINDKGYIQSNDGRQYTSVDSVFPSDKAEQLKSLLKKVIETGSRETIETEIETGLGVRWMVARLSLVSRDPVRVVVTVRDITERKKMEESLRKARDDAEAANRAKSQFLSNMSHELRTPLNAVLGFAQVLEMDQSTTLNGLQEECVYEIMKAGNHLLELINEVLDLAKIEAGKTRLSIEPVDISTVIEETMTIIIPTAEKYGISVESEPGNCSHRYVKADKTKLKQILINLLSNAIKYNKENGTVRYYCEVDGGLVRFHVEDTGIGIPEEELEAIYKPFYRLGNSKNIIEGTGVGLSVVKQLTEMMGGVIRAESIEGKGSHFYIELPSAEEMTLWSEREEITVTSSAADIASASNKKILYIEDNSANLRLVERILELIPGTIFLSAQTAEEGIEIAVLEKPDVILLDINLPGMDGYEAFETLQEIEETEYIPVIAVSSNAMEREIGRAIQMGFFDYITKPIKADVFLERIKRVFG